MKEYLVGIGTVDFGFLVMIGYNIMPLVLFGGLAVVCYMFLNMQGVLRFNHLGSQNGKKRLKEVSFDDIGGQDSAINELGEALEFLRSPDLIRQDGHSPLKRRTAGWPAGNRKNP